MFTDEQIHEIKDVNPNELFTKNEEIDAIRLYDSTVEIIGFVDGIEAPRLIGNNKQYNFFKFYLNNGNGKRIQIVAWNENVDIVEKYIQSNYIIYLDGLQARPPKFSHYNNGSVPFELQVQSSTVVSTLGKYESVSSLDTKPDEVKLSEVFTTSNRIILQGYIKTNFSSVYNNKLNKKIGCGSITNGTLKLEIHIINFVDNNYFENDIRKGDKFEVIGIMNNAEPPYLIVNSIKDIRKLDGHMSMLQLLKGVHTPKKRKINEDESINKISQNKKNM